MSKLGTSFVVTVILLLFADFTTAQTYSTGTEIKKADVNLTDLANYYLLHPQPLVRKMPFDEDNEEERPKHHRPHPSEIHLLQRESAARQADGPITPYLPVSIGPVDTFQSTVSNGTIIPPDTHGAVDSQYCVTAINTAVHIQTRGGANVLVVGLDAFWGSVLPATTSTFDPRVHYDPFNKRWIMVTDAVDQTSSGADNSSTILIAVSATSDPTGTWHMFAVAVDPTNAAWMDFPNVGFNNKWITVTGNMFQNTSGGATGAVVYVFDYAGIMSGSGATFTKFSQTSSFSISPAITYDVTEPNMFAIENWSGSAGELRLWKISGPVGSPTMTSVGYPASTTHWKGGPPGGGDFAPQVGGTGLLNIGDDRITRVMYRNHKLWCSYTAFLPASGTATRSSIMWWQIDTLANPLQVGLIDDPTSANFYAYSSIAVNVNDDALIGFAAFSHTSHPSGGYALHLAADPVDSTRPPYIFRHGLAYYYETFGGSRNRWGDYSGACVDPRNDSDFWTLQESSIVGTAPNWDTWWASIQFCPKPLPPTLLSSPSSLCIGSNGTYKLVPVTGATNYVWNLAGTGWSTTGSNTDSLTVTIGSGTGSITVLAYNACGEGEAQTFNITPTTVPAQPTMGVTSPACIGSPTASFLVTSGGATSYSWQALGTGWSGSGGSTSFTANVGTGTGTIILTASNTCGPGVPDTLLITPAVVPVTTFTIANHATNVNVNDVLTFTGTAPAGSTYNWNFGGGTATPGTGAGPQTVYWFTPGTKTVTLTVVNGGCTDTYTDTVNVAAVAGVHELSAADNNIMVIPNPNFGTFKLVFNDPVNKAVSVAITDMAGHTVFTNDFGMVSAKDITITASDLAPGNYTVSINIDGGVINKKITISK